MTTRPPRGEAPGGAPGGAPGSATVIASLTNGSPWTRPLPNKVPEVSPSFWVLTVLSTMVGASVADFLSAHLGLGVGLGMSATTAIVGLAVVGTLMSELSTGHLVAGGYWLAVVVVSVLGTLLSDDLVDNLGVSLWSASAILSVGLAVCFLGWYFTEHTVSVHAVVTRRRESWYWLAVLCALALGAALGDLVSARSSLGYVPGVAVFGGLTAVITVAHVRLGLNAAAAFWAAYVVTRPLGDSIADLMTSPSQHGGLGLGTAGTCAIVLAVTLVLVGLSTALSHRSSDDAHGAAA